MNLFDENVRQDQCDLSRSWRIAVRRIGREVGRKGMEDNEIIPLLHQLERPTLFTLDADFYNPGWRHAGYCLVHLDVADTQMADYVRRVLKHPALQHQGETDGSHYARYSNGLELLAPLPGTRRASFVEVRGCSRLLVR